MKWMRSSLLRFTPLMMIREQVCAFSSRMVQDRDIVKRQIWPLRYSLTWRNIIRNMYREVYAIRCYQNGPWSPIAECDEEKRKADPLVQFLLHMKTVVTLLSRLQESRKGMNGVECRIYTGRLPNGRERYCPATRTRFKQCVKHQSLQGTQGIIQKPASVCQLSQRIDPS